MPSIITDAGKADLAGFSLIMMNADTLSGSNIANAKLIYEIGFGANSLTLDPVAALDAIEILVFSGTRINEWSL